MTVKLQDAFTETSDTAISSHTPDTYPVGSSWAESGGGITVYGATDDIGFSSFNDLCVIDADTSGDANLEIDINCGGADNRFQVFIKRDSTTVRTAQDGYCINVRQGVGDVYLYETLNNSNTTLDSDLSVTINASTTYKWEVEYISSTGALTVRKDDVDLLSATDSTYDAQTYISLQHAGFATSALRMDNLVVDDLVSAGGTILPLLNAYHG